MPKARSLEGQYGNLTALGPTDKRNPGGGIIWKFLCKCGKTTEHEGARVNRGEIVSCGCSRKTKDILTSLIKAKYRDYKHNANIRDIPFELTCEEFGKLVKRECHYCGSLEMVTRKTFSVPLSGIDRVDNAAGYIISNCVPCCKICNYAKRALPQKEFAAWIQRIVKHGSATPDIS